MTDKKTVSAFPTAGIGFAARKSEEPRRVSLPSGRAHLEEDDSVLDEVAEQSGYGRRSQPTAKARPTRESASETLKARVTPSLKNEMTDHKNSNAGLTYTRILDLAWAAYKEKYADQYPDEFKSA